VRPAAPADASNSPTRPADGPADVFDLIGDTPLLRLPRLGAIGPGIEVYLKAEWFNPGGSVKDRAARAIILDAEARGLLRPGKILIDSSSGNTGIAYAMLGAARGYEVHICLPANANQERKQLLALYGATIILTDPLEGSDGAIRKVRELVRADPDRYFYADQYSNEANWRAHFTTTGPELVRQTRGRITHLVAGLGTSGTLMGAGRYLKAHDPSIRLIAVQPDSPFHGLEGLKHMETSIVPAIYDPHLADRVLEIDTDDAQALARRLAREEGLLVGISSGAALSGALRVARELLERGESGVIVAVAPDGGGRYLSETFWTT
jgi:cysteine synthase B